MIEVRSLTKRYGARVAVDDLSFVVKPGVVTGFLGPNGSGKSTTMRLILGLDAPTAGTARVAGRAFFMASAVFTVALGALIRNTAGAVAAFAGILFVLPGFVGVLSTSLQTAISPYLPSNAASALFTATPNPDDHFLAPWAGFAVFCGYTAVLLAGAAVLLLRRDV